MKQIGIFIILAMVITMTVGCGQNNTEVSTDKITINETSIDETSIDETSIDETSIDETSIDEITIENTYQTISAVTAKEMMDENEDVLILDVRTLDEYNSGHIEGAVLLPNTNIAEKAKTTIPDLSTTVLVYCRSGNRSASASAELASMGYTNVYDFGGIIDWTYDTVTE